MPLQVVFLEVVSLYFLVASARDSAALSVWAALMASSISRFRLYQGNILVPLSVVVLRPFQGVTWEIVAVNASAAGRV